MGCSLGNVIITHWLFCLTMLQFLGFWLLQEVHKLIKEILQPSVQGRNIKKYKAVSLTSMTNEYYTNYAIGKGKRAGGARERLS